MVKCMIVDDEPLAQQIIERYLLQTEGLQLAAKCFTASEAFTVLHQQRIDLVFLDIRMPGISGIDFIRSLKDPPKFIFTTAYTEYAITGYELEAVDYLLKPVTLERFQKSIQRYRQQNVEQAAPVKDYVYIKVNGELLRLFYNDILYAQSMKDYIKIFTTSGNHLTHMTMNKLMELLPSRFKRVHRSYALNTDKIDVIGKDFVEIGKVIIPVGESYKSIIADRY